MQTEFVDYSCWWPTYGDQMPMNPENWNSGHYLSSQPFFAEGSKHYSPRYTRNMFYRHRSRGGRCTMAPSHCCHHTVKSQAGLSSFHNHDCNCDIAAKSSHHSYRKKSKSSEVNKETKDKDFGSELQQSVETEESDNNLSSRSIEFSNRNPIMTHLKNWEVEQSNSEYLPPQDNSALPKEYVQNATETEQNLIIHEVLSPGRENTSDGQSGAIHGHNFNLEIIDSNTIYNNIETESIKGEVSSHVVQIPESGILSQILESSVPRNATQLMYYQPANPDTELSSYGDCNNETVLDETALAVYQLEKLYPRIPQNDDTPIYYSTYPGSFAQSPQNSSMHFNNSQYCIPLVELVNDCRKSMESTEVERGKATLRNELSSSFMHQSVTKPNFEIPNNKMLKEPVPNNVNEYVFAESLMYPINSTECKKSVMPPCDLKETFNMQNPQDTSYSEVTNTDKVNFAENNGLHQSQNENKSESTDIIGSEFNKSGDSLTYQTETTKKFDSISKTTKHIASQTAYENIGKSTDVSYSDCLHDGNCLETTLSSVTNYLLGDPFIPAESLELGDIFEPDPLPRDSANTLPVPKPDEIRTKKRGRRKKSARFKFTRARNSSSNLKFTSNKTQSEDMLQSDVSFEGENNKKVPKIRGRRRRMEKLSKLSLRHMQTQTDQTRPGSRGVVIKRDASTQWSDAESRIETARGKISHAESLGIPFRRRSNAKNRQQCRSFGEVTFVKTRKHKYNSNQRNSAALTHKAKLPSRELPYRARSDRRISSKIKRGISKYSSLKVERDISPSTKKILVCKPRRRGRKKKEFHDESIKNEITKSPSKRVRKDIGTNSYTRKRPMINRTCTEIGKSFLRERKAVRILPPQTAGARKKRGRKRGRKKGTYLKRNYVSTKQSYAKLNSRNAQADNKFQAYSVKKFLHQPTKYIKKRGVQNSVFRDKREFGRK